MVLPSLKYGGYSEKKKEVCHGRTNFGQKIMELWGGFLNERTNDQIIPRRERSLINDKCIFQ